MRRPLLLVVGLLLLTAVCCSQPGTALRILVLSPFNSRSHDAMSDRLAKALAARGHRVDAVSHYPPKRPIANYQHHSIEHSLPAFTNNLNFSDATQFQAGNPRLIFKRVAEPVCELMGLPVLQRLIKSPPSDPPYDLVILQVFVTDCFLAWGRHLGVPLIGVTAISSPDWYNEALGNPVNRAVTPGFGTDLHPPMNFWQRLYNVGWTSFTGFMFSSIFNDQNEYVRRFFGADYPGVIELRKDLDLLIVNTHYSLEGAKPHVPAIVDAAGIHIPEEDKSVKLPAEVQKWLDDSKEGCVYFTLGSMVRFETFPRPVLDAFYESFRRLAPVRVLMKIAKPEELPRGLPSNVMTQSWFSQVQVFKHKNVKAFITHGGLMSAIEAIHAGIPMIGIPVFGDQHMNVKMNVRRGIATSVQVDSVTADGLTEAIKDVLYKPSYRENMAKLSARFVDRPMEALDTAIYWVEYVARHGKKCLRSPIVDMPWWQANLLDVYAFMASVLIAIYYVLKFSIKKIWNTCCARKHQSSSDKLDSKKKR